MKRKYSWGLSFMFLALLQINKLHATDYYLKSTGAITTLGNWGTNTDGTGTAPSSFTSAADVWHFDNRATASMVSASPAFATLATVIIENGTNLTISSAGVITSILNISSGGTLTINNANTVNFNSLDAASTVVISSTLAVVRATNYGNLTIAANTQLSGSGTFNVIGVLTLNASRTLTLNAKTLYLNGAPSIAGTGSIYGDNAAIIALAGGNGGNNGTLTLATGGQTLNSLQTTYNTGTDYIVLGTDLSIENTGLLFQVNGGIDLNGKTLTVDATSDASFPASSTDGELRASGNSNLILNGTIGANGGTSIFFNSTNNTIKSFTLNANGQTAQIGSALNITDNLDVLDGTLDVNGMVTLVANSSRTGRIGPIGATGSITGNITAQTFHTAGLTDWANLGANGVTGATVGDWDGQIPITCTGCTYGPSSLGGFASIQGWDESTSTFIQPLSAGDPLTPGVGFWVFLGTGLPNTTSQTWSFSGPVAQGIINVPITAVGTGTDLGFNLIANPYASPISWFNLLNVVNGGANGANLASGVLHIYNPNGGQGDWNGITGTNGVNDIIPAGQGFFVENAFGATFDFDESVKVTANTSANPLLRAAGKQSNINAQFFKLKLEGFNGEKDETAVCLVSDAKFTKDKYDARKIFESPGYIGYNGPYSDYTTISTKDAQGKDYAIQAIPETGLRSILPLLVKVTASGSFTISAREFDNYGSCIVIRDRYNNSYHDLKVAPYVVTLSDTTTTPRFELIICESGGGGVVSVKELSQENAVQISKDANGVFVKTAFEKDTKATISVFNVIGQQVCEDVQVEGTTTNTRLNIDVTNQVLIIKVTTDTESYTKKVIIN
jgi:hypothetical protein